jgi:hypothetical protein
MIVHGLSDFYGNNAVAGYKTMYRIDKKKGRVIPAFLINLKIEDSYGVGS